MRRKAICVLVTTVFLSTASDQTVIENPAKPASRNAGRVVSLKEEMRIEDTGAGFFFKTPYTIRVSPRGDVFIKDGQEQALQFDPQGRFVRNLFKKGQGPGELTGLLDIWASPDRIYLLGYPLKVLVFNERPFGQAGWYAPDDRRRIRLFSGHNRRRAYRHQKMPARRALIPAPEPSRLGFGILFQDQPAGVEVLDGSRSDRYAFLMLDGLKANPLPWLLEEDNPSVRYFALIDILGAPSRDPRVIAAKKAIMEKGIVPKILARQKKGGYWEKAEDFYGRTKYKGTVWQLIILAELGADGNDPRIKSACEFVLQISQDRESGGFAYRGGLRGGGQHSGVLSCLTGNMVWSLIRLGFLDDPRVKQGIDWLSTYARFDDGADRAPTGWPYDKREPCWGRHTCHSGAVKILKALAEIPEKKRSREVKRTIGAGAEYFLKHHVYKRSHDLSKNVKPKWLKFGFPTMWDGDALEVLGLLAGLGYRDPRMRDAAKLILSKQDASGRWALENTYNGRFQVDIEKKGKPSKWVTLLALKALKPYLGSAFSL